MITKECLRFPTLDCIGANTPVFSCRNLPYRISEANIGQIWKWWVSRQQRSGHKSPPNHKRPERQQTPLLPKPVMLMFPVWLSEFPLFTPGLFQLSCCCQLYLSWVLWQHDSCMTFLSLFFAGFFCFFVVFWFQKCLEKNKTIWVNSLEAAGGVCYYEIDA